MGSENLKLWRQMTRPDYTIRRRQVRVLGSKHWNRVRELNEYIQEDPIIPMLRNEKERLARARLILEETLETIEAMGFHVCLDKAKDWGQEWPEEGIHALDNDLENVKFVPIKDRPNLVEIADGLADISVVTIGTMSRFGIADGPLLQEVDLNNFRKCGPGSYIDEHGKLIKSKNHPAPNIRGVLENLGWKEEEDEQD